MCACAPVPLLWFRVGRDDDGGARRHSGLPLHCLQQRSQPPGHPAGEVSALNSANTCPLFLHLRTFDLVICWPGATWSMALRQCLPTWSTRICTSMTFRQLKPVRNLTDKKKNKRWTASDSTLFFFFFSSSFLHLGLMGGAPCPAEILRKLRTDMNMKEITVSSSAAQWWCGTSGSW